jgi:DNA-binding transcriptional MerR regulator
MGKPVWTSSMTVTTRLHDGAGLRSWLGVQAAFLRSLDVAGVVAPQRSDGGHRRYSRRQLEVARRMRELFDRA